MPVRLLVKLAVLAGMLLTLAAVFTPQGSGWAVCLAALAGGVVLAILAVTFARAVGKGRGRPSAAPVLPPHEAFPALRLRKLGQEQPLLRTLGGEGAEEALKNPDYYEVEETVSLRLRPGDLALVEAGQVIPADGRIVAGAASIDEAAQTGESAPVLREAEGSDPGVRAGTRVLSGCIVVSVAGEPDCLRGSDEPCRGARA
jgi:K+-transporting ATPase ATPase B chain